MRLILLLLIKFYWFIIPEQSRRQCIFKKSCSHYVYDETKNHGLLKGLKTLKFRMQNCHPDFDVYIDYKTGKQKMILRTGIVVDEDEISEKFIL